MGNEQIVDLVAKCDQELALAIKDTVKHSKPFVRLMSKKTDYLPAPNWGTKRLVVAVMMDKAEEVVVIGVWMINSEIEGVDVVNKVEAVELDVVVEGANVVAEEDKMVHKN